MNSANVGDSGPSVAMVWRLAFVIAFAASGLACDRPDDARIPNSAKKLSREKTSIGEIKSREALVREQLEKLAGRHEADTHWARDLESVAWERTILTIEMQRALATIRKRPAIAVVRVTDVYESPQGVPRFVLPLENFGSSELILLLDGDEQTLKTILAANDNGIDRYFGVVFDPDDFEVVYWLDDETGGRPPEPDDDPGDERENAWLEEGKSRPAFVVRGRCLELVYLEDYDPSWTMPSSLRD